ncbi:hypothetical protein [Streptococcus equi]|uniref:hypothetical protein n=1 Tax=Streptococcus equi TaxID=1336 RepID=UPI001D18B2BC|nr:hypothetical protein [Streptococcus equi]
MPWTEKKAKNNIISNIALYRCFIYKGHSKNEAKELVKEYSFCIAEKTHRVLKIFFYPRFFKLFCLFMRKGMLAMKYEKAEFYRMTENTIALMYSNDFG